MKIIIKIAAFSIVLFFLLIIFGMKYHWVDFLKPVKSDDIHLTIPNTNFLEKQQNISKESNGKDIFQPEIIPTKQQSIIANMTKSEIVKGCQGLFAKVGVTEDSLFDMAVGDCVVSNYQEDFQDIAEGRTDGASDIDKQQRKILKKQFELICFREVQRQTQLGSIEKQLLMGVCISDKLPN